MFVPIVAHRCGADRLYGGMAAQVAIRRQHLGIAFAGDNKSDNPHPGRHAAKLILHGSQAAIQIIPMIAALLARPPGEDSNSRPPDSYYGGHELTMHIL